MWLADHSRPTDTTVVSCHWSVVSIALCMLCNICLQFATSLEYFSENTELKTSVSRSLIQYVWRNMPCPRPDNQVYAQRVVTIFYDFTKPCFAINIRHYMHKAFPLRALLAASFSFDYQVPRPSPLLRIVINCTLEIRMLHT